MRKIFMYSFVFCITFLFLSEFIATAYNYENDIGTVIGIDLGTTYSRVGVYRNGTVEIIANYPSWVAFTDTNHLVGDAANNQASFNPQRTIFDFKRLIGKKFDDLDVQHDVKMLPYEVVNEDGKPYIQIKMDNGEFKVVSINEITTMVLRKMKESAESYLGKEIKHMVISVPVNFTEVQWEAIKDAGVVAGLKVVRIINEPTAAAIAYGFVENDDVKIILVYDLGGGTFDVSIVIIERGVVETLATGGDIHLGGEDFDERVMNYFIELIMKKYNKDISQDKMALDKLRRECERAKKELSSQHQVQVEIENLFDGIDHFSEKLTRGKFEELNMDLFKKTMEAVERVMKESQLKKSEIEEIVLVGGSSRIPKVQELLKEYFDGKEPYKGTVNPDEAVVHGATVQGGIISEGAVKTKGNYDHGWFLLAAFPCSLGIETVGGVKTTLIPQGTIYGPTERSQIFTTYQDNQTIVSIKVYEGDCLKSGQFDLSGIAPAPRGVPEIEVTFKVDYNDILNVTAEDKATKNSNSITIKLGSAGKGKARMMYEIEEGNGIQNVTEEVEDQSKSIAIMNKKKRRNLAIHDEF